MKNKTQFIFVIGASVGGVLIVGCAILLFLSYSKLDKTEKKILAKQKTLEFLYSGNPFPSAENVAVELQNGVELNKWLQTLLATAAEGQLDLDMRTPSKFMRLLDQTVKRLEASAGENVVPNGFQFGFGRYLVEGSELPQPQHVPRLAQELAVIERVCDILFTSGISQLSEVHREVFEDARAAPARTEEGEPSPDGSLAGEITEGAQYGKLTFKFEFEAPESAFLSILNQVSSNDLFISVGQIVYRKRGPDVNEGLIPEPGKASLNAGGEEGGPDGIQEQVVHEAEVEVDDQGRLFPSRYRRIVSGPNVEEPMQVTLELNVFRFSRTESESAPADDSVPEDPAAEAPVVEAPVVEAPAAEAPVAEAPVAEAPVEEGAE